MAYLKDELQGFVPTESANEIMKDVARGSSILRLSKVEQMQSDTKKFPIMTDGPGAYWVGESERIQTSTATWIFPEMTAKKLAVIIPVTKEKLNDTTMNVFAEMRPAIAEAFYKSIDAAAIFGTNSPFSKSILSVANGLNAEIVKGSGADLVEDVSNTMALIEDAGLDVNGFASQYGIKKDLRNMRDANGVPLYDGSEGELYNNPIEFVRNGAWDKTEAELIAGNWNYSLVGIRANIEYEILKEATLHSITMGDGSPLSLAENDMIAIKATMRIGFLPIKDEGFAILRPEGFTVA